MRSHLFDVVLIVCLITGTWMAAQYSSDPRAAEPAAPVTAVQIANEPDALDLRTGDHFWGFMLCGVVPCSAVVVKGGGHMVTLAPLRDMNERCFYQVNGDKKIKLHGQQFTLRVTAADEIHVERSAEPVETVAQAD